MGSYSTSSINVLSITSLRSAVRLSVIMLNVVMLSVVAPLDQPMMGHIDGLATWQANQSFLNED